MNHLYFSTKEGEEGKKPNIDAVIRIKDGEWLCDENNKHLQLLLISFDRLELRIVKVGMVGTDIIIAFSKADKIFGFSKKENSAMPFPDVVTYAIAITERYAHLIDQDAIIEIVTPNIDNLNEIEPIVFEKDSINVFNKGHNNMRRDFIPISIMEKVNNYIDFVMAPRKKMLGDCHWAWHMKKLILFHVFHLRWLTPSEMNPDILFD